MSFRSILCPVDLSATSRAAARTAAVMADCFKARLTVVFVDDPLLSQAAVRFDEDETRAADAGRADTVRAEGDRPPARAAATKS